MNPWKHQRHMNFLIWFQHFSNVTARRPQSRQSSLPLLKESDQPPGTIFLPCVNQKNFYAFFLHNYDDLKRKTGQPFLMAGAVKRPVEPRSISSGMEVP